MVGVCSTAVVTIATAISTRSATTTSANNHRRGRSNRPSGRPSTAGDRFSGNPPPAFGNRLVKSTNPQVPPCQEHLRRCAAARPVVWLPPLSTCHAIPGYEVAQSPPLVRCPLDGPDHVLPSALCVEAPA